MTFEAWWESQANKPYEGIILQSLAAFNAGSEQEKIKFDVIFDGCAIFQELDEKQKSRTSAENVSDVLDAVVRLMSHNPTQPAKG